MTALAIIQARMGSTRLPGKVLKTIGAYPAIYHTYHRARLAVPNTVVAIPATPANHPLYAYLRSQDIPVFAWEGPEDDVLGRYHACAQAFPGDWIVRITGDCPVIDPAVIRFALNPVIWQVYEAPYRTNTVWRTYPRGVDVEVFSRALLDETHATTTDPVAREHVTPAMRRYACPIYNRVPCADHRWVLDTPEDLAWFRRLATHLDFTPPHPTTDELLAFLERHPEHVKRDVS